ncbi:putative nucleotide-diphospho-sugar transferase [Limimaricola cinnabarinus]|jgi:hypothetical protein|uniref:putative nucleotide-diphospho-sugar transferase n=1 Tax=Limimaricola cinnabarinus TaxID=1125964 RepID=UPI002491F396|nr:putative nucleotide-diphospho-sugar transferase [Limimaricola cinnabarinus]
MTSQPAAAPSDRGFVFAATSPRYTIMAQRAARNLRMVMPEAQVDLFTDQDIDDPVFDQIHKVEHVWHRPKMEAMRRSRFERTVMLDADLIFLAPVWELFDILDRFEFAGCHGNVRRRGMGYADADVPRSFPVINTGVLALRRTPALTDFLQRWEDAVRDSEANLDQPTFRRMLYESDLRFVALPVEYNMMHVPALDRREPKMGAPRILHLMRLDKMEPGDPTQPFDLKECVEPKIYRHARRLLTRDWSLKDQPIGLPRMPAKKKPTAGKAMVSKGKQIKKGLRRRLNRLKSA